MYQVTSKTFAKQCFFNDHFNHKTVNKTTCRMISANPCQLCEHSLKSFWTIIIFQLQGFWGLQDLPIYLGKNFGSLLNCLNLISQRFFAGAMYKKQFNKLVSW